MQESHILQSASDIIIVLNEKKILTHVYGKSLEKYEWNAQKLIGKSFLDFINPEQHMCFAMVIDTVFKGETVEYDWNLTLREMEYAFVLTFSPLKDESDTIYGVVGVACDITDKRKGDERKDLILGTASHELKNALTSMKAYIQLLDRHTKKLADEKSSFYISKIEAKTQSLHSLIQDMLDMTKLRTNKLVLRKELQNIDTCIDEIIKDIQPITKTHTIHKKNTMQAMVSFDHTRIEQVLSNMIRNAIKYSPDAKEIHISLEKTDKEIMISVKDFGIGIPQDKLQDIFLPFSRVDDPTKPRVPGFGLGLYISAEIITLHGGRMWVESEEGKGSTFIVTLPTLR